jgi:hypothetical protein
MVEAGGQSIHGFRHGPDYSFIRPGVPWHRHSRGGAGRVIRLLAVSRILVAAPGIAMPSAGL